MIPEFFRLIYKQIKLIGILFLKNFWRDYKIQRRFEQ